LTAAQWIRLQARWRQQADTALLGHAHGPSGTAAGASWLISPLIDVGTQGDFSIRFDARFHFEADAQHAYDGGVIEISLDNGSDVAGRQHGGHDEPRVQRRDQRLL
jgi:hypothetical protein